MVNGYKCFNKGLINRYGHKFEEGEIYHYVGDVKFHKSGFHMCSNLEDTLRYFDAFNDEVDIASVTGYGDINAYDDEYNGFYDMYAVEYLKINHVLTRDEIIEYALKLPEFQVKRFISLFKLTNDEIELFQDKFFNVKSVILTIDYYQNKDNDKVLKLKR